jgi:hypothetical protein
MRSAVLARLVTIENAVVVCRYRERPSWAAPDTGECRWRQSPSASACVCWCRGSRRSGLRSLQLWSAGVWVLSLSTVLLAYESKGALPLGGTPLSSEFLSFRTAGQAASAAFIHQIVQRHQYIFRSRGAWPINSSFSINSNCLEISCLSLVMWRSILARAQASGAHCACA